MNDRIPQTPFALLSGSATWGVMFPDGLKEPGVRTIERDLKFDTPWGISENWQIIELDGSITADGKTRLILNIFAHGWAADRINHECHRQVFWVLREAGVKKVLADSTCGSTNQALQPKDYLIVSDCIDLTQTEYSVAPGRFAYANRGKQLICPQMGQALFEVANELWPSDARVYGPANNLVVMHVRGPRFETPAEARAAQLLGADFVNQSISVEATNAREVGACFVSGSYVVNYVDGILEHETGILDKIHGDVGEIAGRISIRAMAKFELLDACGCEQYHAARPSKYRDMA